MIATLFLGAHGHLMLTRSKVLANKDDYVKTLFIQYYYFVIWPSFLKLLIPSIQEPLSTCNNLACMWLF